MRPLLICDCDEVLLHMVRHFGDWVGERHDMDFTVGSPEIFSSLRHRATGEAPGREKVWELLDGFFPHEMGRQTLVPHAAESLAVIAELADVVILTNLGDQCREPRIEQLARFGIEHRVECNRGGKGDPVATLVAEHGHPVTVFVDDLPVHHESVAAHAPEVHRLHMVSEPELAPHIPLSPHAHARIDDWRDATRWIIGRFTASLPATDLTRAEA
ncbi:hypothetical protein [Sphingomonas lenta]|uniref:HAD family hydrolase n=1 Tax=Sphingomonas lenta TaxID=1141887 RepID=A0A2A2SH00_9SPHN|nr:hypothetical protein [Sphingomonas lenta]PAX08311.1 hypothetical protein CKY28_07970 [Sphingomonas lenta]